MKNISKIVKYSKKLKYKVSKNKHTTDKGKKQSQIKIHNEHLNNINKIGQYKKQHDGTQNRYGHY